MSAEDRDKPWWRVHYQYRYALPTGRYVRWTWMEVQAANEAAAKAKVERIIFDEGRTLQVVMMAPNRLDPCWVELAGDETVPSERKGV